MTTKYVRTAGGNSNTATTFALSSGGTETTTVPGTGDLVICDANSGQLTVNAAMTCLGIDFTGYTNTLTNTSGITCAASGVKLVAAMGYSGTGSFTMTATGTFDCGGKTILGALNFSTASTTITLAQAVTVNGLFSCGATTANTINGYSITCTAGCSCINVTGTTNIKVTGGTISGSNNTGRKCTNNFEIDGNVTFSSNILYMNGTITYTSGTITGGKIGLITAATFAGTWPTMPTTGLAWTTATLTNANPLSFGGASIAASASSNTLTLGGNLTLSGTVTVALASAVIIPGAYTFNASGATLILNTLWSFTMQGAGVTFDKVFAEQGCTITVAANTSFVITTQVESMGSTYGGHVLWKSGTPGTKATITYNGTSANMNFDNTDFTDITASNPIEVHGSTSVITTSTGITKHDYNAMDFSSPGAANIKKDVTMVYQGSMVIGIYNPLVPLADITTAAQSVNINNSAPAPSTPPVAADYLYAVIAGVIP